VSESDYTRHTPLGKNSPGVETYTPALLCPLSRQLSRADLGLHGPVLPFSGVDIWNLYELSWLNVNGVPQVAIGRLDVPCDSVNLVESKSLKLYLNSFNQSRFDSIEAVAANIQTDVSACVQSNIDVSLYPLAIKPGELAATGVTGVCLDGVDISAEHFTPNPQLLKANGKQVAERLYSNLFRSCCPVTGQPDWASIVVDYQGSAIDRDGLLQYLVSFRKHNGFHEQCVERIFIDINERCRPTVLSVYAAFLRRGGIDINPLRTNNPVAPQFGRFQRQ
jgi:7-cyano-7-deazaguanine reductase